MTALPSRSAAQDLSLLSGAVADDFRLDGAGLAALHAWQQAISHVLAKSVPGDILEVGVGPGARAIVARAALAAAGVSDRVLWLADDFAKAPSPSDPAPANGGEPPEERPGPAATSRGAILAALARYHLLDHRLGFLDSRFRGALPVTRLAALRLETGGFDSTRIALEALYAKMAPGGRVIIGDYGVAACRTAVDDFRYRQGISAPLIRIDAMTCYWLAMPPPSAMWRGYAADKTTGLIARATEKLKAGAAGEAGDLARQALRWDGNATGAHELLARLRHPGPDYLWHLAALHHTIRPRRYIEIGVAAGKSLALVRADGTAVGIDPAPQVAAGLPAGATLVRQTSDQFFADPANADHLAGGFDLALIDGCHEFPQVLRDFINLERHAAPGALIVFHDTLPLDRATAAVPRRTRFFSGDAWKAVAALIDLRPDLDIVTIGTFPTGLTLVRGLDPGATVPTGLYDAILACYGPLPWDRHQQWLEGKRRVVPSTPDVVPRLLAAASWPRFDGATARPADFTGAGGGWRQPGPGWCRDAAIERKRMREPDPVAERYLRLLRQVLTDFHRVGPEDGSRRFGPEPATRAECQALRRDGRDWPAQGETMVGLLRLEQFQQAVVTVVADDIPGDIMETGVWRGGAGILARAVLAVLGVTDRQVWLADSFAGLPAPRPDQFPADAGDRHYLESRLKVSRAEVAAAFEKYDLLDDQVRFLEGWFKDTLPTAPVDRLAVLRLDGDMYESTWIALDSLYHRVSPGGFVIIDDYGAVPGCRAAVDDFRRRHKISEPLVSIDWCGVYWRTPAGRRTPGL